MIKPKYIDIAEMLKERIEVAYYQKRLPAIRQLADDFSVAPATMQRAVRELVIMGLVTPMGPKGNLLNAKSNSRPKTGIIGIFCNFSGRIDNDPLLNGLQKMIKQEGKHPLLMTLPNQMINHDDKFWISNWLDGYIFVYSTISKELAYELRQNGIPFVVANRCPENFGANWIDFDKVGMFRDAVSQLVNQGHKSIGVSLPLIRFKSYRKYLNDNIRDILKEFNIYNPKLVKNQNVNISNKKNAQQNAKYYMNLENPPTAIIIDTLPPNEFLTEFSKRKIPYTPELMYIGDKSLFPLIECPAITFSYQSFAEQVWTLFKQVMENSNAPTKQYFIGWNITKNHKITKKIIKKEPYLYLT
ncbi:MAG: hypothetical protein WCS73_03870 [Lentisphaeria bacterium]